ncbi:MAG: DUF2783 domain-containing protein [Pseudomonadota bacterium]
MTQLILSQNIADCDGFYELLIDTHQGLSDAQSQMLNAQLILLLSNHIGDAGVLREALALARANVDKTAV